jgi:hypothetical protein
MLAPSKGVKLTVGVSQIQLDPEDELTQHVDPKNVVYYVYENKNITGVIAPTRVANQSHEFALTASMINNPNG